MPPKNNETLVELAEQCELTAKNLTDTLHISRGGPGGDVDAMDLRIDTLLSATASLALCVAAALRARGAS